MVPQLVPEGTTPTPWRYDVLCGGNGMRFCGAPGEFQVERKAGRHGYAWTPSCNRCLIQLRSGQAKCCEGCCTEELLSAYSLAGQLPYDEARGCFVLGAVHQ